ncbi:DMT family transporter [Roseovarius sp. A21]|uniref:DMT family transporter n=1 Tax=Roseovarius bejariae TaxID=2576383 RepID=A0A844D5J5_9RHOB|nr:DMT family transporter [Roseovarius bejariae]MRU17093.1 DMT family transporter [Roseovarius bejariae]
MSDVSTDPAAVLPRAGYVFALLSAVCYGSITTFASLSYAAGLEVEHLVISRGVIVAVICFGLAVIGGQSLSLGRIRPLHLAGLALALVATAFCQLGAVQYISVGMTVILFFTFPLFVTLHDMLTGRVRAGYRMFLAPVLALAGIAIATGPGTVGMPDPKGVGLALLAAMAMAASIVLAQRCMATASVFGLGLAGNLLASVLGLALWTASGDAHLPVFEPGQAAIGLVTMAAVGALFGIGILFQFRSIRSIGSTPTSMTLNFEPVVTLAVAAVLIGELLSAAKLLGAGLIIMSVFVSSRAHRQPANTRIAK